ncbi:MAG: TerB family tellurite resistance protein [Nitratireductor sp.]
MTTISADTLAVGQILALLALADGEVRDIENETAEVIIENVCESEADAAKFVYESALVTLNIKNNFPEVCEEIAKMTRVQQYEVVRACWYMAQCDEDLCSLEENLIYTLSDRLGISRYDCLLAKKSAA